VGAGEGYAVLEQDYSVGRVFYVNGTAEDLEFNNGDLLTDGGTPVSLIPLLCDFFGGIKC